MRTILFVLLFAACEQEYPTGVGATASAITVIPAAHCTNNMLKLFDGRSFSGNLLCLSGLGTYVFPPAWSGKVRSFDAGTCPGSFNPGTLMPWSFAGQEVEANVGSVVANSTSVGLFNLFDASVCL